MVLYKKNNDPASLEPEYSLWLNYLSDMLPEKLDLEYEWQKLRQDGIIEHKKHVFAKIRYPVYRKYKINNYTSWGDV